MSSTGTGTTHERTMADAAATLDRDALIQSVIAPYEERLRADWGDEFDPLVTCLATMTAPWRTQVATLAKAVKAAPTMSRLVIVGERGWPASGLARDNEQFTALLEACRRLNDTPFHVLFTGGCVGLREQFGEVPALLMLQAFNEMTERVFEPHLSVDQMSLNTGHQARIIGSLIHTLKFGQIVVCLPIEHIARFTATLCYDLLEKGTETKVVCFPNGDWNEVIPWRGPAHHDLTRAQEAFGDLDSSQNALLPSKALGGEYRRVRWGTEAFEGKKRGYACPALLPSQLLPFLLP